MATRPGDWEFSRIDARRNQFTSFSVEELSKPFEFRIGDELIVRLTDGTAVRSMVIEVAKGVMPALPAGSGRVGHAAAAIVTAPAVTGATLKSSNSTA